MISTVAFAHKNWKTYLEEKIYNFLFKAEEGCLEILLILQRFFTGEKHTAINISGTYIRSYSKHINSSLTIFQSTKRKHSGGTNGGVAKFVPGSHKEYLNYEIVECILDRKITQKILNLFFSVAFSYPRRVPYISRKICLNFLILYQ